MNAVAQQPTQKDLAAMPLLDAIQANTAQFLAALPSHIPVERFKRVVMTAISSSPDLAQADRRTLFNSAVKAAQDGLLPDGREGALVIYNTKIKEGGQERWVKAVQWMPMIAGIRKKVRNSGEIVMWDAHVVYQNDEFDYKLGLNPDLHHKPLISGDRGKPIAAYSVAKLKSGEFSFEVMSADEIMHVWSRSSKAKDKEGNPSGPWKDHQGEMFRKTVARRHSKVLPMSTDLDDLIRRDDDLYDFHSSSDKAIAAETPARPQIKDFTNDQAPALTADDPPDEGANTPQTNAPEEVEKVDADTGEIITEAKHLTPEEAEYKEWYTQGLTDYEDGKGLMAHPDNATPPQIKARRDGWNAAEAKAKRKS